MAVDLRLIASDIDGTLLGPDHAVTERTIAALQAAHGAGVEVVAATGRSLWSAVPLLEPIGCVRWLLASNGANLFDLSTGSVVESFPLERDTVRSVAGDLRAQFGALGHSWETTEGVFQDEGFRAIRSSMFPSQKITKRATVEFTPGADELSKLMILHPTLADMQWFEAAQPHVPDELNFATSGLGFVELTSAKADKGIALSALCERLGIDQRQTVSFGDQLNDLGMLRWTERGYAMENAHAQAAQAASHAAPHHLDDGVAQIVEQLLGVSGDYSGDR